MAILDFKAAQMGQGETLSSSRQQSNRYACGREGSPAPEPQQVTACLHSSPVTWLPWFREAHVHQTPSGSLAGHMATWGQRVYACGTPSRSLLSYVACFPALAVNREEVPQKRTQAVRLDLGP